MARTDALIRFGERPFHLAGDVDCIAPSPDGRLLAAGTGFGDEVVVWERGTGRVVGRCREAAGDVGFANNDELWFAYARLLRWNLNKLQPETVDRDLGIPMVVSPSGRWIAASGRPSEDGDVDILDAKQASRIRHIAGHGKAVRSLSFSRDERWLAIGFEDKATVVDVATGQGHEVPVPSSGLAVRVRFCAAHDRLLIGRRGAEQMLVSRIDGSVEATMSLPESLDSFALSPDGGRVALAGDSANIFLLDCPDGTVLASTPKRGQDATIVFVDQGRLIAASGHHAIGFIDASTGRALQEPEGHDDALSAIAVSPDGSLLATGGGFDMTIRLWSTQDATLVHTDRGPTNGLLALAFSPQGDAVVSGGRDGALRAFAVGGGKVRFFVESAHGGDAVTAAAWTARGEWIATTGDDGRVVLRDPDSGSVVREIATHPVKSSFESPAMAISADGRWIASTGAQGDLTVHELATGAQVLSRQGVKAAALSFAPDAPLLAFCSGSDVVVVEIPGGRELCKHAFTTPSRVALGPDSVLACIQYANSVELLDIKRGDVRYSWGPEQGIPTELGFSPDGRLAVGYAHGAAALIPIPPRVLTASDRLGLQREQGRKLVRQVIELLAEHREPLGYRDAPAASELDPDRCGARISRSGVKVHVRVVPLDEGFSVEFRTSASESPVVESGAPQSGIGKLVSWIRKKVDEAREPARTVDFAWLSETLGDAVEWNGSACWEQGAWVVSFTMPALPSPHQLEGWAQACARRVRVDGSETP